MFRICRCIHITQTLQKVSRRKALAQRGKYGHISNKDRGEVLPFLMQHDLSNEIKKGNYHKLVDEGKTCRKDAVFRIMGLMCPLAEKLTKKMFCIGLILKLKDV